MAQSHDASEVELAGLGGDQSKQKLSYPSKSLHFLRRLEESRPAQRSPLRLNIIVVGAGLGGLATSIALSRKGHRVTVLEQVPQLGEVGAGIQIPPNSSRLLLEWGLEPFLQKHVVEPESIIIRRWQDGSPIGLTRLKPDFRIKFHAPYYLVHRAHFHDAMHQLAVKSGAEIKVAHKVVDYDENVPSVTIENGQIFTADLIVAADGVRSIARSKILGGPDVPPRTSGFAAFRATIDASKMRGDPELAQLLDTTGQNLWIGYQRHIMAYTIAGGSSFNMVLNSIDHSDPSTWNPEDAVREMREWFKGWDPRVTKLVKMIDRTLKWPLMTGTVLDRWVSKSGKLVMLGDASHAMVPYMSQGAAMAVEDGGALAEALRYATDKSEILPALKIFENIRIKRSAQMQQASLVNGVIFHYPDGPQQRARDAAMRPEVEGRPFMESPNQWSDPTTQAWSYGYDAGAAIQKAFEQNGFGSSISDPVSKL